MIVKELIVKLLDCDIDADIVIETPSKTDVNIIDIQSTNKWKTCKLFLDNNIQIVGECECKKEE